MKKIKYHFKSFRYAFRGVSSFFRLESKSYIHLFAAVVAVAIGGLLEISATEWLFVILAIALVFITEFINTLIEKLADMVQPEQDDRIAEIKDMAAGAVLIASIAALIIGLVVFLPKLIDLI